MTNKANGCKCGACSGAACKCGCQEPKTQQRTGCQCGENCKCGNKCNCKA